MGELPWNRGLPRYISASIQPRLHISTYLPQLLEHSSIYGGRYHLVAIFEVRQFSLFGQSDRRERMSPKSHILISESQLIKMLEGLRSLCISCAEWRQWTPLTIWQKMYCLWISFNTPFLMARLRSASMNQRAMQTSFEFSGRRQLSILTILGWLSFQRYLIYLQTFWASVGHPKAFYIFFKAHILDPYLILAFQTCPYAPCPTFLMSQQTQRTCQWIGEYVSAGIQQMLETVNNINQYLTRCLKSQKRTSWSALSIYIQFGGNQTYESLEIIKRMKVEAAIIKSIIGI